MLQTGIPTKVIAASLGLSGFAVAIVAGMAAANPAPTVLLRALGAMAACHVVGVMIGMVGERCVRAHLEAYRARTPVPAPQDPRTEPKERV